MNQDNIPAIIEAARAVREARLMDVHDEPGFSAPVLIVPKAGGGSDVVAVDKILDNYRPNPKRREGTAVLTDFDSFLAHCNRFRDAGSAIYVNTSPAAPMFTAVLDYHEPLRAIAPPPASDKPDALSTVSAPVYVDNPGALPRFGAHRGRYEPEFSAEWKRWIKGTEATLSQKQFCDLIESGAAEIVDVGPEAPGALAEWFARRMFRTRRIDEVFASCDKMLDLSQGLVISESSTVGEAERRDGGVTSCSFTSEKAGKTNIDVPPAICVKLPVFTGGDPYQLPARINVSARGKDSERRLEWRIKFYGAPETVRDALAEMRARAATETGLPVFAGSPET